MTTANAAKVPEPAAEAPVKPVPPAAPVAPASPAPASAPAAAPAPETKAANAAASGIPVARPAQFQFRHKGLLASFFLLVVLPVVLTTLYMETRAADQYSSTLAFTVRSEDLPVASSLLGGVGMMLGGGGSKDSDILYEYIRSQEMVANVDRQADLTRIYAPHHDTDPIFAYKAGGTIEDLTRYWRRMVRISYDSSSGMMELRVLAFSPQEAQQIAQIIHDESTRKINDLNAVARADTLRYATEDLAKSVEHLKKAREEVTAFRLKNQIVDVSADLQGQMGLLNTMQAQLAEALIDYDLVRKTARDGDPRLEQAMNRISVIQDRIAQEREKFGGDGAGKENYTTTVGEFERLTVEREFAEARYLASMRANEIAQAEANRQSRYLATYINPTLAQTSEFPQRGLIIGVVLLFSFLTWSICTLIYYAIRDRH